MEVRLRRSIGGSSGSGALFPDDDAPWLDGDGDGGEGGGGGEGCRSRKQHAAAAAEAEEQRRRRTSQASALLAHQNLLMSPGAADRVFGYRSGSSVEEGGREREEEEEEDDDRQRRREQQQQQQQQQQPALPAGSGPPSVADILRGPMRFGASLVERRTGAGARAGTGGGRIPPSSSPPRDYWDREGKAEVSGSASKRWPKEKEPQYRRRRSSLLSVSDSAHRIVCGLRLAHGDVGSIALLLVLYTLQGIPMGLSASVPFLLQERVSYKQQALFSLVSLPFSFKLVWAPIVDSTSFLGLGRRKAWLLPVQCLCGLMMLAAAPRVGGWMGDEPLAGAGVPQVQTLTAYFCALYALMATQDIAVDGWALTMLSRENVGLASTCNTIGQTLGYFLAHVGFLALHSPETCNKFLRARARPLDTGMVTLGGFLSFWGWVFLGTTLLVAFKREDRARDGFYSQPRAADAAAGAGAASSVLSTYRQLGQILRLGPVRQLCLVLLTVKAGFAVTDAATNLKMAEYGMPKEEIALMSPLLIATGIAVPLLLSKATSGPRPLSLFLRSYAPRLGVGLLYGALLPLATKAYATPPGAATAPAPAPTAFRLLFLTVVGLREVAANAMFVAQMAFFARVSDPSIGGTYMTLLNTVSNLGATWLRTASLALLDSATLRECRPSPSLSKDAALAASALAGVRCEAEGGPALCQAQGGACVTTVDGYYVQLAACTLLGMAWLAVFRPVLLKLEALPPSEWCLKPHRATSSRQGAPPPFSSPSSSSASASSASSYYHGAPSAATTRRRSGDNGGGGTGGAGGEFVE